MIGAVVIVALAIGFAVGGATGFVLGLDYHRSRARESRADITPALRRRKR